MLQQHSERAHLRGHCSYKEMIRMNRSNFSIRWALRVRGLNMLSVAVQMHSTLLSHAWITAKQRKMLSRVERKVWPVSNLTQHRSTPLNRVFKCAQLVESLYSGQIQSICTRPNAYSKDVIAIATLSDWPKSLEPVLQPMRSRTKTNYTLFASFFPCFEPFTDNG